MIGPRDPLKLHELVEGTLPPVEEQALRAALLHDGRLREELTRVRALHAILNEPLDVDPPDDLVVSVLEQVRRERSPRSRFVRLPAWAENALVFGGAAALAAVVAVGRIAGLEWAAPWLGRLSVGAADAVGVAKVAAIGTSGSVEQMDWLVRVLTTLSGAGWKALGSSADVLVICGVASLALVTIAARMLWHTPSLARVRGGTGNAHLLA